MISRLGLRISELFRRTAPDPFVLAVLLTALTFALALLLTGGGTVGDLVAYWAGTADGPGDPDASPSGVWNLLRFGMQMCLILVTGHALASSPPADALLARLARVPRNGSQAVALVALVAAGLGVLNWGLGLITGALIARRIGAELARRGVAVHYPLLVAAGYVGLMVWHGGFSGTAPLKVTTQADLVEMLGEGAEVSPIPLTETILSPMNFFVTGGLLLLAPLVLAMMSPSRREDIVPPPEDVYVEASADSGRGEAKPLVPRLLEDTPIVTVLLVALIAAWAWPYYVPPVDPETGTRPASGITRLTPDTVNLTMLMLGLLLHGTPARYVRAIERAAGACAGIILQFPLYAGIMAVMRESGLTKLMADAIASTTDATTLPLLTFVSAGVVNLFVPSGGGQWAVQGPIAIEAGTVAGVAPAKMVMSVAYGDQLTNMLQPFWALPLLAITGMKARDIVGYTVILMAFAAAWVCLGLLVF